MCAVPLLPCYAPAALLIWYRRRYAGGVPGVWAAVAWCLLLGTLPGIGGVIACAKAVAQYIADMYVPTLPVQFAAWWTAPAIIPAPLDMLWSPTPLVFGVTLGPVWLAFFVYLYRLNLSDAQAIHARVTSEKAAREQTQTVIAAGDVVALANRANGHGTRKARAGISRRLRRTSTMRRSSPCRRRIWPAIP